MERRRKYAQERSGGTEVAEETHDGSSAASEFLFRQEFETKRNAKDTRNERNAQERYGGKEVAEETHDGSSAASELLIWRDGGETPKRDMEVQK